MERCYIVMTPVSGMAGQAAFTGTPHVFEHGHPAVAVAAFGQDFRNLRRGIGAVGKDQQTRTGLNKRDRKANGAAVQGQLFDVGQRPAEARGGQRKRRQ